MLYAVSAMSRTSADGWSTSIGAPTFYLDSNVQGIRDERHAERIVLDWLTRVAPDAEHNVMCVPTIATHAGREVPADTLRVLAHAADFMAEESEPRHRGGRCSAYLRRAAGEARAAIERRAVA